MCPSENYVFDEVGYGNSYLDFILYQCPLDGFLRVSLNWRYVNPDYIDGTLGVVYFLILMKKSSTFCIEIVGTTYDICSCLGHYISYEIINEEYCV